MKVYLSVALLLSLAVLSESLPQYNTAWGGDSSGSSGGGGYPEQGSQTGSSPGPSVQCQYQEGSDGKLTYNCEGVSPNQITLSNEHILWLHGPQAKDQELHVTVPNYRVEELIRAAIKKATQQGSTNINILLKKPDTIYDVQAQNAHGGAGTKPVVNLQYEAVNKPVSVHYPGERQYNPLSGPIREP